MNRRNRINRNSAETPPTCYMEPDTESWISTISIQVIKTCNSTLEIAYYSNLLRWLGKNVNFQTENLVVQGKTVKNLENSNPQQQDQEDEEEFDEDMFEGRPPQDTSKDWEYQLGKTAGYGKNYFQYKGKWVTLTREISPQEMLTFTVSKGDKDIIDEILEKAKPKVQKSDGKTLVVYTGQHGHWSCLGGPKRKRPLTSLILSDKIVNSLMGDIRNFLSRQDWYVERGIPYRRGYLIHGPPGSGKSSVIKAIAGEIGYDICVLSLSQKLSDDSLNEMLNQAPNKSIILLEDIDAAFKSREENGASSKETNLAFEGNSPSSLTFRGLLNALDGVGSAEHGQLLFMSTNYPERLDPALVRPGRVDFKVCLDYPDDFQLEGMFNRFNPKASEELKNQFVNIIKGLNVKVSMAMVQGLMLVYMDDAQGAVDNAKEYFESQFVN